MGDLCTVGYERRTVDELITTLTRAAVEVLVDVRLTPLSRKPGLSKNRIATRLYAAGIDYLHLPQLGNPRDNRDGFRRGDDAAVAKYRDVQERRKAKRRLTNCFDWLHIGEWR